MSTTLSDLDVYTGTGHPLDFLEDISRANNWDCIRPHEDKITLKVKGQFQDYTMVFVWDEEMESLQFSSFLNLVFDDEAEQLLPRALMDLNARLWLGHFIYSEDAHLFYHHTILLRGQCGAGAGFDPIEDMVNIAAGECDRFYPLFHMLTKQDTRDRERLFLALTDCEGQA